MSTVLEARLLRSRRHTLRLLKLGERITARPIKRFYHHLASNRLFMVYHVEQADELRSLCGKGVKHIGLETVQFNRKHQPFADEIDLKRA